MNTFNCFQAVGFYTALPFAMQYLFSNGYNSWGYVVAAIQLVGYIMLSVAIRSSID